MFYYCGCQIRALKFFSDSNTNNPRVEMFVITCVLIRYAPQVKKYSTKINHNFRFCVRTSRTLKRNFDMESWIYSTYYTCMVYSRQYLSCCFLSAIVLIMFRFTSIFIVLCTLNTIFHDDIWRIKSSSLSLKFNY